MRTRVRAFALAAAAPALIGARHPKLVADVSQQKIDIVYSFTGAELLLFGAILYPRGRMPEQVPDIIVVVHGKAEPLLVREKARIAGVWINHDSQSFRRVPNFYSIASSRPIAEILSPAIAARHQLGIDNLRLGGGGTAGERARFTAGLVGLRKREGLFAQQVGQVSIRDYVLYRASIPIPSRVPVGIYTAETFLIDDGRIVARARRGILIDKSGFERFVAASADRDPFLYGATAVGLSLALGWVAAMLFRRRGR